MRSSVLLASAAALVLLGVHPAAAQTDTAAAHPAVAPATPPPRRVHHDRYLITEEEMQEHPERNAYDVVYTLRPTWLQPGTASVGTDDFRKEVIVMVNGQRAGGPDELKRIPPESVHEIRFFPGREAQERFGRDYGSGAILVTLR